MKREEVREELIKFVGTFECPSIEALNMAIEALSAEPTDLISRAEAIEELGEYFDHLKRIDKRGIKRIEPISLDCKGIINELPSADRPSGEWIIRENGNKECSLCGRERQDGWDYFCGYCGARMKAR